MTLFLTKQATLVHIFFQSAMQLVLLVPLITMRQFAEERRSGTLELLLTAPVREIDIVVAKFLACMTVLGAMTGLRSEEHTSELQSLMRISYAVFCLKKQPTIHISQ